MISYLVPRYSISIYKMSENKNSISEKAVNYINIIIKIIVILLVGLLIHAIYKGLQEEGYVFQSIQVPKDFVDNGYNGLVVAKQIQDKIIQIKTDTRSSRTDSLNLSTTDESNLDVDLMGIGVSSSNLTNQLRDLFGIKLQTINGELTQLDNTLSLTLRLWDKAPVVMSEIYKDGAKGEAYEKLIVKAAEKILYHLDPYYLAIRYYKANRIEEGKELLRHMINNMPNEKKWAYLAWGNLMTTQNEEEKAEEYLKKAIEIDPNFATANRNLGWKYHSKGEYQKAIDHFRNSLKTDDKNFGANNGIAMAYVKLGDLEKAEEFYRKNITNHPSELWAYGNYSGMLLQVKKDTPAVKELFVEASKNVPYNDDYFLTVAQNYFLESKHDTAIQYVKKALDFNPNNIGALQSYSSYLSHINEHEERVQIYKRMIAIYKDGGYDEYMRMSVHNNLAVCYYELNKLDSALVYANKAIKYLPNNALPYSTLAEVYYLQRKNKMFWSTIEKAFDMGLEFRDDWFDDPPYSELKNNKRFLKLLDDSRNKIKG